MKEKGLQSIFLKTAEFQRLGWGKGIRPLRLKSPDVERAACWNKKRKELLQPRT